MLPPIDALPFHPMVCTYMIDFIEFARARTMLFAKKFRQRVKINLCQNICKPFEVSNSIQIQNTMSHFIEPYMRRLWPLLIHFHDSTINGLINLDFSTIIFLAVAKVVSQRQVNLTTVSFVQSPRVIPCVVFE